MKKTKNVYTHIDTLTHSFCAPPSIVVVQLLLLVLPRPLLLLLLFFDASLLLLLVLAPGSKLPMEQPRNTSFS